MIHIVAVDNEVRELVWELERLHQRPIIIKTVNLLEDELETFEFEFGTSAFSEIGLPEKYLYEPNAAIMKSGGFDIIGEKFGLKKLHRHSHLYTANQKIEFPGRRFEIFQQLPYGKAEMKTLQDRKINITTRNFPDTVENIRKKWKIKDGGNEYCFCTTDMNNHKIVLLCTKF